MTYWLAWPLPSRSTWPFAVRVVTIQSPGLAVLIVSEPFQCVSTRSLMVAWRAAIGVVLRARVGLASMLCAMARKSAEFSTASATSRWLLCCDPVFSIMNIGAPDEVVQEPHAQTI